MRTFLAAVAGLAVAASAAAQQPATRESLVVPTTWVAQHLHDVDLVILTVGEKAEYDKAHLPGARFVDFSNDLAAGDHTGKGLSLEMLPTDVLHDRLAALGISDSSRVLVYATGNYWSPSTRVMLTLDYAGLNRTVWMDGGLTAWTKEGRPTTTEVPAAKAGTLAPLKTRPVVVDADFVQKHVRTPGFAIVDARDAVFYEGQMSGGQRSGPQKMGHIPSAVSAPYTSFADESPSLKSAAEIKAIFDKAGVKPGDTVIGYCHVGQQATAMLFAARTLGHPVMLYDGSFQDWAQRDLPLELPVKK